MIQFNFLVFFHPNIRYIPKFFILRIIKFWHPYHLNLSMINNNNTYYMLLKCLLSITYLELSIFHPHLTMRIASSELKTTSFTFWFCKIWLHKVIYQNKRTPQCNIYYYNVKIFITNIIYLST